MSRASDGLFKVTAEDQARAEEQIRQSQREVDFNIRDFPIDYLVGKFREDLYYIPDYQREYVWRSRNRCDFIESVILGLPIPMMFFAMMDDGRLEIVDGVQRMSTLESFMDDDLKLTGLEQLSSLNGFGHSDLLISQQRKFASRPLRIVVLEERTTSELRYELFKRINTRGEKARPSEIRRGAFPGPFMDFLNSVSDDPLFLELCPVSEKMRLRRERTELVLRFFAYSDRYKLFRHAVGSFLDKFASDHQQGFDEERMEREFTNMLGFVSRHFPHGFAKGPNTRLAPRVRFEAISVGVNLALREKPDLVPGPVTWLESREFAEHTTTHASNSRPRLRGRIEFVRDRLLEGARR